MSRQTQHSVKREARGPTLDAAQQHVLWIYHQIQEWRGDCPLDSLKWGWQLTKQGIMPIEMTKKVAPRELLKIVKYGCKIDCARKSGTSRQEGVVFTNIYWGCRRVSFMNCETRSDTDPR